MVNEYRIDFKQMITLEPFLLVRTYKDAKQVKKSGESGKSIDFPDHFFGVGILVKMTCFDKPIYALTSCVDNIWSIF